MGKTSNLNIKISIGDKQVYYSEEYLKQYAVNNKEDLLQTKQGGTIISNWSGWLTIVNSSFTMIYHAWAGEIELQF